MYGTGIYHPSDPNGTWKRLKNLGWLLRHWRDVDRLVVKTFPTQPAAVLTAHMRDGRRFVSGWASEEVLYHWLHRPVFDPCEITWDGAHGVIARNDRPILTRVGGRWVLRAVAMGV